MRRRVLRVDFDLGIGSVLVIEFRGMVWVLSCMVLWWRLFRMLGVCWVRCILFGMFC